MVPIAERLGQYAQSLQYEDLPQEVAHEVKRRLIDSLACVFGAYSAEPSKIARQIAKSVRLPSGATILGTRHKTSPELATFANGTMLRYLDYNDTYLSKEPAHPSDNIPAALALAEAERRDGKEFIVSVVIGYEVQCRLADAASLRARGWDHVTYGAFSSACVASRLLRLSPDATKHAICLAGVANNALRQTRVGTLSMWKACAFANAARNGIFAAHLANQGMTAPSEIFEGQFGFWNLVSGPFDLGPLGGQDKEPHRIIETYIKFFPAEYHAQTAIEVALELRAELSSIEELASIDIETFDACVDIIAGDPEKWRPMTRETADHSLPYCVAVALMDGALTLESFSSQRISDPRLRQLLQKIKVHRNAEFSAKYPEAMTCEMKFKLNSGKVIRARRSHARGHPKNPMTDAEVESKFRTLTAPVLPRSRANRILKRLWHLEDISDIGSLVKMLVCR
ncbi:MAG: MmgE/PrpD family protein [Candidatus Binatia bacterium]